MQILIGPVIKVGVAGVPFKAKVLTGLFPQALLAETVIFPVAKVPKFTVIEEVPCPETIDEPIGTVHE